jgi:GNAT superfamily N-acetyltransferase
VRTEQPAYRLVVEQSPQATDLALLDEAVAAAAVAAAGAGQEREFGIFVRDAGGRVVAGVSGIVFDRCCELEALWVDERLRGRGVARDLMAAAEVEAARQGCTVVMFHTYDLLVRGLHERLGYRDVAAVEDCVGGGAVRWFRKDLSRPC